MYLHCLSLLTSDTYLIIESEVRIHKGLTVPWLEVFSLLCSYEFHIFFLSLILTDTH